MNFKYMIPLMLFVTMLSGAIPEGYYDGTEGKSGQELQSVLHTIIRGHIRHNYTSVWSAIEQADEDPENSNNVILLYTGRSQEKEYRDRGTSWDYTQYDNGSGIYNDSWNREHVWPKSHGFPNETDTAYTDYHHLRPADRTVNSSRGTKDFDWGDTWHSEAEECKVSANAWEPRDAVKGDVARMIFYMTVRYENTGNYNLEMVDYIPTDEYTPYLGKKSTLLSWHTSDPVDDFERNRNEVIYSLQGNRNPFIDHPEFAGAIWGDSPGDPSGLTISNETDTSVSLNWTDQSDDENGFKIYVNGNLNHTVGENVTNTVVTSLMPGRFYTFGVSAYNDAGESSMAIASGMTTGGISGPLYISEFADAAGTGNYIYEFVEIHNFGTAVYDAGSYKLLQQNSSVTFTLPSSVIIPAKGFLVIGRNALLDDFETFWNVTLGSQVVYINSGDKIPQINGSEQYRIVDASDSAVDPDDGSFSARAMSSSAGNRVYRLGTGNTLSDWAITNWDLATPGRLDADQSLPVTLTFFSARVIKAHVVLEWETSAEIENQGFLLSREERGMIGTGLKPVLETSPKIIADFLTDDALKGQGSTTETTRYRYIDNFAEPGKKYVYSLYDVDYTGKKTHIRSIDVEVKAEGMVAADGYSLSPIYPNPFNTAFTVPFTLTKSTNVSIKLYNLTGQNVIAAANREFNAGTHTVEFNTHDLASGIYIIQTSFDGTGHIQKAVLLK